MVLTFRSPIPMYHSTTITTYHSTIHRYREGFMYSYTCKCRWDVGMLGVTFFVTYQHTICIYMYKHKDGNVVRYKKRTLRNYLFFYLSVITFNHHFHILLFLLKSFKIISISCVDSNKIYSEYLFIKYI